VADRKALLCWQVISLLKYDGYFLLIFTEKRLRNLYMFKIYCDETWTSQSEYINVRKPYIVFYGVLVDDLNENIIIEKINNFKEQRGLFLQEKELPTEIKWQKVEDEWKDSLRKEIPNRYEGFLDIFFENLHAKKLSFGYLYVNKKEYDKVQQRFLEKQNDNRQNFFFMMYFQFLYHCFIKPQVKQRDCQILIDNHDMGAEGKQYDIETLKEILNRKVYREIVPMNQPPLSEEMKKKLVNSVRLISLSESKKYPLIQMADLCAGCIRYALEKELTPPAARNQLTLPYLFPNQNSVSGRENLVY
jgi:hypothetical protein